MKAKEQRVREHFDRHQQTIQLVQKSLLPAIVAAAEVLADALGNGRKLLIMGNGGSAADAQHFAAELVGRFLVERKALPAIALSTDTSILTAVGNDYGFDAIFRRQVEALAVAGDVVLGISTSGQSANVLNALAAAKELGCTTMGLLGRDGGAIGRIVDVDLTVPVNETPYIQEAQLTIIHILCDLVERQLVEGLAKHEDVY
jgi:D-sedoheptulose 7-phosphate isomerase